jgi:outer membrane protein OmpA-like peptidoglycan-associated protein
MRRLITGVMTFIYFMSAGAHAAHDCVQGKKDFAAARERISASADDEATMLLNQSIDECPTYDAYETLAEHLAISESGRDRSLAADAFVAAHARAPAPKDRAQTLYQYAALLNRQGDPQNAYPLIERARALDPQRTAIKNLAADVEAQIQHPSAEQLTRGLRYSLYKGGKGLPPSSVNIQINFETNSTEIDDQTRPNLAQLAETLADPALAGHQFTFVGHSDARGDDAYNQHLSLQRAEAMSRSIEEMKPELKGKIHVEGRGAREPIDPGTDEESLRRNRRLQVIEK